MENKGIKSAGKTDKKNTQAKAGYATRVKSRQKTIFAIFSILLCIILAQGIITCVGLKNQEKSIENEYSQLLQKKADLEENLQYINTPEYVEQSAREMLKMVMPGEVLYVLRDEGEGNADNGSGK